MIVRENPARTDEVVGTVEESTPEQVSRAVEAAYAAQVAWAVKPVEARAAALHVAADRLADAVDQIAKLEARETGKVLADCRGEAGFSVAVLRWYAERAAELLADTVADGDRGRLVLRHRPYGVVAAITPWNAPLVLTMLKLAPALVAGNAIVVKPSPLAPFAVSELLGMVADQVPAGLVQVVHGSAETAAALVGHPQVHKVAFTGGEVAGRAIAGLAAQALTPSVLELGGNDPAILLPDADLDDDAMDRLVMATFATSGQVCMAVKRIYAPRDRVDEIALSYRAAADRVLRLGDPLAAGATIGPVVTADSAKRINGLVEQARDGGAEIHLLGTLDPDLDMERGYFVQPALAVGGDPASALVTEEQFGPAVPLLSYDTVDEAVAAANAGDHGLGASVWSADEDRAFEVAARLDAGFTFVNTHNRTGLSLEAPFGGVKRSGWGREYGDEGLLEYVQTCAVNAPAAFRAGGDGLAANAYPTHQ